jgi:hypothetical protein
MDEAQRRRAANEAVFREVNERIEELQREFAATAREPLHLVCECDRLDCSVPLDVPIDVYERTRADPARFLVKPGHQDETVEDVFDAESDYLIVRKHAGDPQRVATETDPRS